MHLYLLELDDLVRESVLHHWTVLVELVKQQEVLFELQKISAF